MIGLIFYWIFIVRNVPTHAEEEEVEFFIVRLHAHLNSNLIVWLALLYYAVYVAKTVRCVSMHVSCVPLFSIKYFLFSRSAFNTQRLSDLKKGKKH